MNGICPSLRVFVPSDPREHTSSAIRGNNKNAVKFSGGQEVWRLITCDH